MSTDAREAQNLVGVVAVAGVLTAAVGVALMLFSEGGSDDAILLVGYALAGLGGTAVWVALTAIAVALGVRAAR